MENGYEAGLKRAGRKRRDISAANRTNLQPHHRLIGNVTKIRLKPLELDILGASYINGNPAADGLGTEASFVVFSRVLSYDG